MSRHPPPSYEEDRNADPYVYDDGGEPDYGDTNYVTEDPNPRLADDERQETDEDVARMLQDEADAEVAADAAQFQGDIDEGDEGAEVLDGGDNAEGARQALMENEPGYGREMLDDTYNFGYGDEGN